MQGKREHIYSVRRDYSKTNICMDCLEIYSDEIMVLEEWPEVELVPLIGNVKEEIIVPT